MLRSLYKLSQLVKRLACLHYSLNKHFSALCKFIKMMKKYVENAQVVLSYGSHVSTVTDSCYFYKLEIAHATSYNFLFWSSEHSHNCVAFFTSSLLFWACKIACLK